MSRIRKGRFVFVVLAVYIITFGIGAFIGKHLQADTLNTFNPTKILTHDKKDNRINILLMGIDARPGEINARSDTMIFASIDKKSKQTVMVWIPRDTRIEVSPGNFDKINSVNCLQGPEEACQAVSKLLEVDVSNYVVTNFNGFSSIIDILGGVHIDVESNMIHHDPDPRLNIHLNKGMQLLKGPDALRYVRYRGGPTADIGRTGRQQKFIKALMQEMISTSTITKLPDLVPELMDNVHTNIDLKDLLSLAKLSKNVDLDNVVTQTLPGYSYTDSRTGASYWHADEEITPGIVDALFAGETFEVISDPPNWVPPVTTPVPANNQEPEDSSLTDEEAVENENEPEGDNDMETDNDETTDNTNSSVDSTVTDDNAQDGDENSPAPSGTDSDNDVYTGSEGYL